VSQIGDILGGALAPEVGVAAAGSATTELDRWHRVGTTGEPAWGAGWSGNVHFIITQRGFVYIIGRADGTTNSLQNLIFTLPEGYRPEYQARYALNQIDSLAVILTNGEVRRAFTATADPLYFGWTTRFLVDEAQP
jgi:hypothetical protein